MDHAGNADLDLGHAELGVMCGNPDIAGGGDFEAAAEAPTGQPRDHGGGEAADRLAEIAQASNERFGRLLVERRHLPDVGAADHALLALAGQDDGADAAIASEPFEPLADAIGHGGAEDIERAGIADG